MILHEKPIDYYIDRIDNNKYFSLAGFSDAEWYCMINYRLGTTTGLGQILDGKHGERLIKVLTRRLNDRRFLPAVPYCLKDIPYLDRNSTNAFLAKHGLSEMQFYERDMVTDELAEHAGLHSFINCLQKRHTVIIGNRDLKGLTFLNYNKFITISSPNLHKEPGGIDTAVAAALKHDRPGVYLVSAGISAAIIIDKLHDNIPNSFFIDCGSIWDAFVGIGGQREWRADLYKNPLKWERWIDANIKGTPYKP